MKTAHQKALGANPGYAAFAWQKNAPEIVYPRRSLLAIWLILTGLFSLLSIDGLGVILALLAIAAGIFILLGR